MSKTALIQQITEPNLRTALEWANELSVSSPSIPKSLIDVERRAEIINQLDGNFESIAAAYTTSRDVKKEYFNQMAESTKTLLPEMLKDKERVSIIFRMWSGCLCAAKTIALETRSGDNTPELRKCLFNELINPLAELDPIYKAGVETAKAFKELRDQPYSFEGVPKATPILV